MTENEARNAVVTQAREWLDRNEADGSHRVIIDLYNAHRPPGGYVMSYADPWCAAFVSAVGMAVGLSDVILPGVNCDGMIEAYRAKGQWIEDDGYSPTPGDLIFYDWQDSGVGDNTGSSDHVGIVVEVDGRLISVIEGNYSDSVKRRYIYQDGTFIRGFAVPDYAAAAAVGEELAPPADSAQSDPDPVGADAYPQGTQPAPSPSDPAADPVGADASASPGPEPAKPDGAALCAALPVLSFGCCGRSVVVAQGILIALGYSCGPDGADGDLGYNTRVAVRNFQRGAGIPETGEINALTWAKLLGV